MRALTVLLLAFSTIAAHAGTSIQDVHVFRLRNRFGNADRKVDFKLYAGSVEHMIYAYNCLYRSAKLDDFSTAGSQYGINKKGASFENEFPGFTKFIEVGVYHPDDHVGFRSMSTPGEIQEVEIFRAAKDNALLIERVLVAAPHSLSEKGQKLWQGYQRTFEPAVSFHDEKPGNERWQGLVTGYTICETSDLTDDYNPYYTRGAKFKRGSVKFHKQGIAFGVLEQPWTFEGVTYEGEISFHDDGSVFKGKLLGQNEINGMIFAGDISFYSGGKYVEKGTLAQPARIRDRVYSGPISFSIAWDGRAGGQLNVATGNLEEPAQIGKYWYIGPIQYFGNIHSGGTYEDLVVSGQLAKPITLLGMTFKDTIHFIFYSASSYMLRTASSKEPLTLPNGLKTVANSYITFGGTYQSDFVAGADIERSKVQLNNETACEFIGTTDFYKSGKIAKGSLVTDCRIYSVKARAYKTYTPGYYVRLNESGQALH